MRILHVSDLHGRAFAQVGRLVRQLKPDWIVLTGDLLDDPTWIPGEHRRGARQLRLWGRVREGFALEGATTTLVRGNHEREGFEDLAWQVARPPGLEAQVGVLEGIPAEFGPWGFPRERDAADLARELEAQGPRRIWLSHVPPFGILDRTRHGVQVGHRPLAGVLQGSDAPDLVLCGHVHESFGAQTVGRTLVVNAAAGYAHLEWHPETGRTDLLALEVLVRYRPWRGFLEALRPVPG